MEIKIGAHIAELRRAKNMTQEQLARAVGVSAPAVSKWETDSSYPDITLLCPIARALDTNVDNLLQFEDTLSEEEMISMVNEIVETARNHHLDEAQVMLEKLLCTYPSSIPLKYNAAAVFDTFAMFGLMASGKEEKDRKEEWKERKRQLLQEVYTSGTSAYWQNAASGLASMAIQDGELERAEAFLNELPKHSVDTTMLWTQIHLKKGDADEALVVAQKRLYTLIHQAQICLVLMMNEKVMPDAAKMLEICEVYRKMEDIFGVGGGLSIGHFVEAYRRLGEKEKEKESIIQLIDAVIRPMKKPNPLLFSCYPIDEEKWNTAMTKEMKEMLLQGLLGEADYREFQEDEEFREAVGRLRKSIKMEEFGVK